MITPSQMASLSARRVWLIEPNWLHAMFATIHKCSQSGERPERMSAAKTTGGSVDSGGIAVLPIHGVIEQRYSWIMDWFGGTSTDDFGEMYDAAMANPKVKGIVVDIDSPGGTVSGVMELADKIYNSRNQKPVVAVANSMAASAAYWVGSAFDKLFVTPGGDVGSVGVYSAHADYSKMLEQDGVNVTLFQVPEYKAEFNPWQPLTAAAKENEQAQIERIYSDFTAAVARHRGTTVSNVRENYGKGRVVDAKKAVSLGMADRVATLSKVISRMQAGAFKPGSIVQASDGWDDEPVIETPEPIVGDDWAERNATERLRSSLKLRGLM